MTLAILTENLLPYTLQGGVRVSRKYIDGGGGGRVRQNARNVPDYIGMKWALEISLRPLTQLEYERIMTFATNSFNLDSPAVLVFCSAFFGDSISSGGNGRYMLLSEFPAHSIVPGPDGLDRYTGITLRLEEC